MDWNGGSVVHRVAGREQRGAPRSRSHSRSVPRDRLIVSFTLAASMQTKNSASVTPVDSTVASSASTLPLWMSFCRPASSSALASCTLALSSPIFRWVGGVVLCSVWGSCKAVVVCLAGCTEKTAPRTLREGSTSSTIFFPLNSFTVSFILLAAAAAAAAACSPAALSACLPCRFAVCVGGCGVRAGGCESSLAWYDDAARPPMLLLLLLAAGGRSPTQTGWPAGPDENPAL